MSDARTCDGCGVATPDDQLVTIAGKSVCARCKPDFVLNLRSGLGGAPQISPQRADEIRQRLSKLNLLSFALAVPGFLLLFVAPAVVDTRAGSGGLGAVLSVLQLVGGMLIIGGFSAYAMMKGRSAAFGLLGLLSCIGLLTLALLGKCCQLCRKSASFRTRQCKACGAPM